MSEVLAPDGISFDIESEIAVIGAGACGLCAGLAARDRGAEVIVLERDKKPAGSTALSSGLIPACPTRYQRALDIDDAPDIFAGDIMAKTKGLADAGLVETMCRASGPAVEWLADRHGLEWQVQTDFLYPQHSRHRMHGLPEMTGESLMARLLTAGEAASVTLACQAPVTALIARNGIIEGVRISRPDGAHEHVKCRALILACNGYGGNRELVCRYIPEMADALYFGHDGNRGEALLWGMELGADIRHLGAYQGHGSVAHPHGILISWGLIMAGGIQVNADGMRFSNEHLGYSEQAVEVLAQPGAVAWNIYGQRQHELGLGFDDYRTADAAGALRTADDIEALASLTGLPAERLAATIDEIRLYTGGEKPDPFGRDFTGAPPLEGPFWAVKVTGALFHTQGGLMVDNRARVLGKGGKAFANLYAGGGAACGVSGPHVSGYLSGNGLLSAVTLGRIAGEQAAVAARA
jgi:fumarate reductase flavoprotein subunit